MAAVGPKSFDDISNILGDAKVTISDKGELQVNNKSFDEFKNEIITNLKKCITHSGVPKKSTLLAKLPNVEAQFAKFANNTLAAVAANREAKKGQPVPKSGFARLMQKSPKQLEKEAEAQKQKVRDFAKDLFAAHADPDRGGVLEVYRKNSQVDADKEVGSVVGRMVRKFRGHESIWDDIRQPPGLIDEYSPHVRFRVITKILETLKPDEQGQFIRTYETAIRPVLEELKDEIPVAPILHLLRSGISIDYILDHCFGQNSKNQGLELISECLNRMPVDEQNECIKKNLDFMYTDLYKDLSEVSKKRFANVVQAMKKEWEGDIVDLMKRRSTESIIAQFPLQNKTIIQEVISEAEKKMPRDQYLQLLVNSLTNQPIKTVIEKILKRHPDLDQKAVLEKISVRIERMGDHELRTLATQAQNKEFVQNGDNAFNGLSAAAQKRLRENV